MLAGGDEEEGGPDDRGGGGLKHAQLLAVPDEQGRERGEGAGEQAVCTSAEARYKVQDPPDHENP